MWKSTPGESQATDDAVTAPEVASTKAARGGTLLGKKLIVLLVAGLVLAGSGIGAARFLGAGRREAPAKPKVVAPLTYEFGDLVVNIAETRDMRMLRCVILVEVDGSKGLDELGLREVVFRDEILDLLQSKTLEDLKYPGKNAIKRQIRDRFNRLMVDGGVVEVYFKEFLVH